MVTRADKHTSLEGVLEFYSDVPINFDRNPVTGNLAKIINEDAVKASLRDLILTDKGERLFSPTAGSKLRSLLFELSTSVTRENIKTTILQACSAEPRASIIEVDVQDDSAHNLYRVSIVFTIVNATSPIQLDVIVKRVR